MWLPFLFLHSKLIKKLIFMFFVSISYNLLYFLSFFLTTLAMCHDITLTISLEVAEPTEPYVDWWGEEQSCPAATEAPCGIIISFSSIGYFFLGFTRLLMPDTRVNASCICACKKVEYTQMHPWLTHLYTYSHGLYSHIWHVSKNTFDKHRHKHKCT